MRQLSPADGPRWVEVEDTPMGRRTGPFPFKMPQRTGKVAGEGTEKRVTFQARESIFEQGMPGGDLYFIEEGEVEVFSRNGPDEIVLSTMKHGEILGVVTFMTKSPRMASARAKTPVTCKLISRDVIASAIASIPPWMKIVLKEFSIRLEQMNDTYSKAFASMRWLESHRLSYLYTGAQVAAAVSALAEVVAIKSDLGPMVVIEDILAKLEMVLNLERSEVEKVFGILDMAGLIKAEMEPDKKRIVIRLENAQKVSYFAQFLKEAKSGPTKKLIRAKFTNRETRVMSAIVKLAIHLKMDVEKRCQFSIPELERNLEKITGVKFERDALDNGIKFELLQIEEQDGKDVVIAKPVFLGRTVACIEAHRRLVVLDESEMKGAPAVA